MTRQIVVRQMSLNRRQPLLASKPSAGAGNARFAEVAGGTTAECAAVCCCCPCGIVDFIVLTVYRLPAGLCRKALRNKRRRRLMKKQRLFRQCSHVCDCGCYDSDIHTHSASVDLSSAATENLAASPEVDEHVLELEKEMWDKFYGTGFWRSPSQKE